MGIKTLIKEDWRKRRLIQQIRKVERKFGGDVAIRGSYTGNLGDILIGRTIKHYLQRQGRTAKLFSGIHEDFSNYNYLVMGGGQIIQDDVDRLKSQRKSALSANSFSLHGVGATKLNQEQSNIADFLKRADKVSVRDKRSKDNLKKSLDLDAKLTSDPVFSLNSKYGCAVEDERVGVNFRPVGKDFFEPFTGKRGDEEDLTSYKDYCQKLWNKIESNYDSVEYIPFDHKDNRFAENLGIEKGKIRDPENLLDYIDENFSKLVCTRYHSLIVGLITGKDLKVISYAPKVQSLCERLNIDAVSISELPSEPDIDFTDTPSEEIKRLENLANEDLERLWKVIEGDRVE